MYLVPQFDSVYFRPLGGTILRPVFEVYSDHKQSVLSVSSLALLGKLADLCLALLIIWRYQPLYCLPSKSSFSFFFSFFLVNFFFFESTLKLEIFHTLF